MKKAIVLIGTLILIAALSAGCAQTSPNDAMRTIMVNGVLYYDTGNESDLTGRCGVPDGEITSAVARTEIPAKDNQSNFGKGYEYQFVDEAGIDVLIDQKWVRFEKDSAGNTAAADAWGVRLSVTGVTPTGLILVCEQSGGQPTGDLQTGSQYWLETKADDQWAPVPTLPGEDPAWDLIAYAIRKNDTAEWEIDWKHLYGALPAGTYRIGKEITDFRDTRDYDNKNYYAGFEISKGADTQEYKLADIWAKAWMTRDGKARYDIMGAAMRATFEAQQLEASGPDGDPWVIRWSSPWVTSYTIDLEDNTALINYEYTDSTEAVYEGYERITFGEENGRLVVIDRNADYEDTIILRR